MGIAQTFLSRAQELYNSTLFQEVSEEASAFFAELPPYVGGRPIELQNAVSAPTGHV